MRKRDIRDMRIAEQERKYAGHEPDEPDEPAAEDFNVCDCAACSSEVWPPYPSDEYSEVRSNG